MADPGDNLLKELFLDLNRKVEEGHVRLEHKIDALRESVDGKLETVEEKVNNHEKEIEKHSHTFTMVGSLTGVLATLAGLASWVMSVFPNTKQ